MKSIRECLKPCPSPEGRALPDRHRGVLGELLRTLHDHQFRQSKLNPLLPGLVEQFAAVCSTEEDFRAWAAELESWVRWYRVPAFWLTFLFQLVTQKRNSVYHFLACDLFSDAQTNFADDLAVVSLETAYHGYLQNRDRLGGAYAPVEACLTRKLRVYYDYYVHWSRPFDYAECNPCADHLYSILSRSRLEPALGGADLSGGAFDAGALARVIEQGQGREFAYYGILARRFLGLLHGGAGRHELSAEQYRLGLEQARQAGLDAEIGHFRRLYGCALRALGKNDEARRQFEQAYAYEQLEPLFCYTAYWQALSARELGDTLLRLAGRVDDTLSTGPHDAAVVLDDPEKLRPALNAYHDGRLFLSGHLSLQCPFPIGRAAKQQIFRSFSGNAIQVACMLQSPQDMLAEVEWNGPREATEVVAEIAAARDSAPASLAEFRRNRARYNKTLNTLPGTFEDYLAGIPEGNAAKRAYLETSFKLDSRLLQVQACDEIVKRVLALRLPDTVFLLFHVGSRASMIVLVDMSSGVAAPFPATFGEEQLRAIHEDYAREARDTETRKAALGKLLSRYGELLGPTLEPLLRFLPGKHLKIFPRLQMNAVPLHALSFGGKFLLEHCEAVSYGQTLGLLLESHAAPGGPPPARLRVVVGQGVPWYEFILPQLRQWLGPACVEDRQAAWPELLRAIAAAPAGDMLFACHGRYDPEDPRASDLELSGGRRGRVLFPQVFEELDLRGCRSVIMGACESGLTRSTIGAEYIGLPSAMLSSGARYVIGALWKIPQAETAVLVRRYLELLREGRKGVCAALCGAQRELLGMTKDQFADWVLGLSLDAATQQGILRDLAGLPEHPFAHPYHWAGLQAVGDV